MGAAFTAACHDRVARKHEVVCLWHGCQHEVDSSVHGACNDIRNAIIWGVCPTGVIEAAAQRG